MIVEGFDAGDGTLAQDAGVRSPFRDNGDGSVSRYETRIDGSEPSPLPAPEPAPETAPTRSELTQVTAAAPVLIDRAVNVGPGITVLPVNTPGTSLGGGAVVPGTSPAGASRGSSLASLFDDQAQGTGTPAAAAPSELDKLTKYALWFLLVLLAVAFISGRISK